MWSKDMKGVVSVVTGGGKTFFALMCVIKFLEKYPAGQVLVIIPTIALQDQWSVEISSVLGVSDENISHFPDKKARPNTFNILVINTARNIDKSLFSKNPSFLIVDECHKAGSKENSKALAFESCAELGLSATPKRENDTGFEDYIEPKLGSIVYEYSYSEAYKDGVISKFNMTNIKTTLREDEGGLVNGIKKRIAIELSQKKVDYDKIEMLQIKKARVIKNAVNRLPVALKIAMGLKMKKIIVFCESIKHCLLYTSDAADE